MIVRAVLLCSDGHCSARYVARCALTEVDALVCECGCGLQALGHAEPDERVAAPDEREGEPGKRDAEPDERGAAPHERGAEPGADLELVPAPA